MTMEVEVLFVTLSVKKSQMFFNSNHERTIIRDSANYVEAQSTSSRIVETQSLALGASDKPVIFAKLNFFAENQLARSFLTQLCHFYFNFTSIMFVYRPCF